MRLGLEADDWDKEDSGLHKTFGNYIECAYYNDFFEHNIRSTWQVIALRLAAESGCYMIVSEVTRRATFSEFKLSRALRAAVMGATSGHTQVVRILLHHGAKDREWKYERSILHWAVAKGNFATMELLLSHKYDVNATDCNGKTPLRLALGAFHNEHQHDMTQRLLQEETLDVNALDGDGWTPLLYATHVECVSCVQALLYRGAQVDGGVRSPLVVSARKKDVNILRALLDGGAVVNATDEFGRSALHFAAFEGNQEALEVLLAHGATVDALDADGSTALLYAASSGQLEALQCLLPHGADITLRKLNRDGVLELAFRWRRWDIVHYLVGNISSGGLVEQKSELGDKKLITALKQAAQSGYQKMVLQIFQQYSLSPVILSEALQVAVKGEEASHTEVAHILMRHGVTDTKDQWGRIALHWAAETGNETMMELFLSQKENINAMDSDGKTALHLALGDVWKKHQHKAVERLLQEETIETSVQDARGMTPLLYAINTQCESCVEALLLRGADVNTGTRPSLMAALDFSNTNIFRILLEHGANVDTIWEDGYTALLHVSKWGRIEELVLLLSHGANVNTTINDGSTALHLAAWRGQTEVLTLLISKGANVSVRNPAGDTALDIACDMANWECAHVMMKHTASNEINAFITKVVKTDNTAILKFLLEEGVSPNVSDEEQNSLLHLAAKQGHNHSLSLLLEHGADVNASNSEGDTALHKAAKEGRHNTVRWLLSNRADRKLKNKRGKTALKVALEKKRFRSTLTLYWNKRHRRTKERPGTKAETEEDVDDYYYLDVFQYEALE